MSKEVVEQLIGREATKGIREMGGVMSKVVTALGLVVIGELEPKEGLEVFNWAVEKEEELREMSDPKKWEEMVQESMEGRSLKKRGRRWFCNRVNEDAGFLGKEPPYPLNQRQAADS